MYLFNGDFFPPCMLIMVLIMLLLMHVDNGIDNVDSGDDFFPMHVWESWNDCEVFQRVDG